jgi:hypothetical protein
MSPTEAAPFSAAVEQGKLRAKGGDRKSEQFKEKQEENQSGNTPLKSLGARKDTAYIRARLERDGKTELLTKVVAGEMSAHAAAIEAGFRKKTVQVNPTLGRFNLSTPRLKPSIDTSLLGRRAAFEPPEALEAIPTGVCLWSSNNITR